MPVEKRNSTRAQDVIISNMIAITLRVLLLVHVPILVLLMISLRSTHVPTTKAFDAGLSVNLTGPPARARMRPTQATTQQHAHGPKVLGRYYDVEPEWEGSTYSYVRPDAGRNRNTNTNTNTNQWTAENKANKAVDTIVNLEFPHCGTIAVEQHPDRVSDDGASGTGHALWSSALAISSYLDAILANDENENDGTGTGNILHGNTGQCLEIGAGLGLPTIVVARHGRFEDAIATDTDREPGVLAMLEKNLQSNLDTETYGHHVKVEALDWAEPKEQLLQSLAPDLIIASDLVWNATRPSWPDLFALLNRLRQNYHHLQNNTCNDTYTCMSQKKKDDPMVLMGYTQRRLDMDERDERKFFDLIRSYGMTAQTIPSAASDHWPLTVIMKLTWKD